MTILSLFIFLIILGTIINKKDSHYDEYLINQQAKDAQEHLWKVLEAIHRHKKLEGSSNEANHSVYRQGRFRKRLSK